VNYNSEELADLQRRLSDLEDAFKNYKLDNAKALQ